jgi:hypothetical protein
MTSVPSSKSDLLADAFLTRGVLLSRVASGLSQQAGGRGGRPGKGRLISGFFFCPFDALFEEPPY